jgi:HTH-type transcriptional regulator, global nitrogen regulator NrpRI
VISMNRQMFAILGVLNTRQKGMSSKEIAGRLSLQGSEMSDRTVRYYLKILDGGGYTKGKRGHGRMITRKGEEELGRMFAFERVGFAVNRINNLTFLTNLNVKTGKGDVILNITYVPERRIEDALGLLEMALNSSYGMSNRIVVRHPGETLGPLTTPEHMAAVGTVCSITLNGILLKAGVSMSSKFGGIVEIIDGAPTRFLSVISYQGSSVAPLEIFMKSRMTDVLGALRYGTGRILGSFREIPEVGLEETKKVVKEIERIGLRGSILFGKPGRPLLGVPVMPNKVGVVVLGGLNPAAALLEAETAEETHAMATLYDYAEMSPLENPVARYYPLSRLAHMEPGDNLHTRERRLRSDYWSVFDGLKQTTL